MGIPEPKVVFIDTEQFDARGLSFNHTYFKRLAELRDAGLVEVILTDVVVGEVKRHVREKFHEARKTLGQKFGGLFKNLVKTPPPQAFNEEYWKGAEEEVLSEFNQCLKKLGAKVVPIVPEHVGIVFGWYFNHEAPFDTQKRKSEFPDAFSIAAINDWAKREDTHVHAVSGDAAFSVVASSAVHAPHMTYHSKLESFFELFPEPEVTAAIKQALADFLEDEANFNFGQEEFSKLAFYVEDTDSLGVGNVTVLYSEPDKMHVIAAKGGQATLAGQMYVHFMADVERLREPVMDEAAFVDAEIELRYDEQNPSAIEVLSVKYAKQWAIDVNLPSSYRQELED